MPTSKGAVAAVFADGVQRLADQSAAVAASLTNTGQRAWERPGGWSGDPHDAAGLTAAYDRSAIEELYRGVVDGADPGTVGDAVSLKTQGDYVAAEERALRARYTSPVRALALAAARRQGHGDPQGIFVGQVLKYAQDAIKAGGQ